MELRRNLPFGVLKLTCGDEEVAILKLISCDGEDALMYWERLWKDKGDYEDLPFSCKELMPSAVRKIQAGCSDDQWRRYVPKNARFLAGLPRYTWTKNRYIINEYRKIAAALDGAGLEFLAIKGVCEMLDGNDLSLMRTSRDIDLLIHEDDWVECKRMFEGMGWSEFADSSTRARVDSPIRQRVGTFRRSDGIFDLDVHFAAIHGAKAASRKFTDGLWARKVRAKNHPDLFIPSLYDRYVIAVANAFDLYNWREGHTTKYILDILSISSRIDDVQLLRMAEDAERSMGLGDAVGQATEIAFGFRGMKAEQDGVERHLLHIPVSPYSLLHIDRFKKFFQLVGMLTEFRQIPQVLAYATSRTIIQVCDWFRGGPFPNPTGASPKRDAGSDARNRVSIHLFPSLRIRWYRS